MLAIDIERYYARGALRVALMLLCYAPVIDCQRYAYFIIDDTIILLHVAAIFAFAAAISASATPRHADVL